jgi:hypothetical protein
MIKKPIIAITGCIGSGKDTIGKIICELDPEYFIYKFATPLRKVFSIITGIPEENTVSESDKNFDLSSKVYKACELKKQIEDAIMWVAETVSEENDNKDFDEISRKMFNILTSKEYNEELVTINMTVGQALQIIGTECFRNLINENIWINWFFNYHRKNNYTPLVITDLRFLNEALAIKSLRGIIIRVEREDIVDNDSRLKTHISECELLDALVPDMVIKNNGTIEDLTREVRQFMAQFISMNNLIQTTFTKLGNIENLKNNPEAFLTDILGDMTNAINQQKESGNMPPKDFSHIFGSVFSAIGALTPNKKTDIELFFANELNATNDVEIAKIMTKEHFNLVDGYKIEFIL